MCTGRVTDTADVTMHVQAGAVTVATLIAMIQGTVRQPILDRIGLDGRYDIDLDWLADSTLGAGTAPAADAAHARENYPARRNVGAVGGT